MTPEKYNNPEREHFPVREVLVAGNRGPCGGVNMAIEVTDEVLRKTARYPDIEAVTFNPIVHYREVMDEFTSRGLKQVSSWDEVEEGSVIIHSAHGVTPEDKEIARQKNCAQIDTTCQLVSKVHNQAKRAVSDGDHILLLGSRRKDGSLHPEPRGVIGEVPEGTVDLITSKDDLSELSFTTEQPLRVLTQTTLSNRETAATTAAIVKKWPWAKVAKDICYATDNRQQAVVDMVRRGANDIVVVGSGDISHNTKMLAQTAEEEKARVFLVESENQLREDHFRANDSRLAGVISGASVPDQYATIRVLNWFEHRGSLINWLRQVVDEDEMTFKKPEKDLEELDKFLAGKYGS